MLEAGMSGEGLEVFERLAVLMGNMTPLARLGAEALQRSTEESLATGVAPATGQAWAPLSASTLQRRAKEGRGGGYRTEALLRSLDVGCSADTA
ncbi:MAG: phage virion morphogenesis protein, partial [Bilophila sp.]